MSIRVTDLHKRYGTEHALKGISFAAKPGRVLGFLGPNGAGKTTTMKILSGSLTPTSGHAALSGIDISQNRVAASGRLGYLPEHNPLYLDMYVREALTFMADRNGVADRDNRIKEVIGMTGVKTEQHKNNHQLSTGYRQRIGLAQAVLHNPNILILVEPTSGLDPNQLQDIRSLIKILG